MIVTRHVNGYMAQIDKDNLNTCVLINSNWGGGEIQIPLRDFFALSALLWKEVSTSELLTEREVSDSARGAELREDIFKGLWK